jgi:hypothetical protein
VCVYICVCVCRLEIEAAYVRLKKIEEELRVREKQLTVEQKKLKEREKELERQFHVVVNARSYISNEEPHSIIQQFCEPQNYFGSCFCYFVEFGNLRRECLERS